MEINLGSDKKKEMEKIHNEMIFLEDVQKQIKGISRRFKNMEDKFEEVNNSMVVRDESWDGSISSFEKGIEDLKLEVESLAKILSSDLNHMQSIISKFKDAAKNNEKEESLSKLDGWKVEGLVTRDRFKKLLIEEINNRT
ncbi:hypothetical protein C0585_06905 [Candidatus Woesearchaeota archaeon]|nr:MAG: hypothetical protein C0585_06905 [Candidatus Woesearchaeota archaeon]